jgi:hypothetical protein
MLAGTASHAQTSLPTPSTITGYCFVGPANTFAPCPASPTATAAPILPEKNVSVSGPTQQPAGTTMYNVTVTSRFLCFAVNEPIYLYTIGNQGISALTEQFPVFQPFLGYPVTVLPDQTTGTATLSLEVFNAEVGPAGLDLKAVWPVEQIERVVNVIAPAPPTPTATPLPGAPATATPTTTSVPGTPPATPTATATPAPAFFVRSCVTPNPMIGAVTATLYGLTLPGAVCTSSVTYNDNTVPANFTDGAQVAGSDGLVSWTFTENTTATGGTAKVTCSLNGQTQTSTTAFTVVPPTPTPGAGAAAATSSGKPVTCSTAGGVQATAGVQLPFVTVGGQETVFGCLTRDGQGVGGVTMSVFASFASGGQVCTATTNATGLGTCTINTSTGTPGEQVPVYVNFIYNGQTVSASTSFTVT